MPTLVCVPIFVEAPADAAGDAIEAALADAALAMQKGADLVEFRIDRFFHGSEGDAEDAFVVASLRRLLAESPLPVILTCRPVWEGGDYDGDDADRIALFEKLCCDSPSPPAYLDVELAAYTRSANLRQKINLCVAHPKQQRGGVSTRLILSTHDFETRPADLDRRLLAMYDEPACAVVKVAHRARSLRDNLDLFEILRESPKPTIALGMGEFGLMSRVLAPKFNGFLTFASLRDESATAPGQPTIDDLLGMYRFRSIGKATKLYGVIGWPVGHSLSPLIHNAGFAEIGWDGVYLPLPIAADEKDAEVTGISFRATVNALLEQKPLAFTGASVTIPYKTELYSNRFHGVGFCDPDADVLQMHAANTMQVKIDSETHLQNLETWNTDAAAIGELIAGELGRLSGHSVGIVGTGGVARAALHACAKRGADVVVFGRSANKAERLLEDHSDWNGPSGISFEGGCKVASLSEIAESHHNAYINCTPVGMTGGPDHGPWGGGLSIPVPDMTNIDADTVFFDTVYNPVETPMLKAARERGCRTIDGVQMFVRQAAAQFELWTGEPAPIELFDRLCREKLG